MGWIFSTCHALGGHLVCDLDGSTIQIHQTSLSLPAATDGAIQFGPLSLFRPLEMLIEMLIFGDQRELFFANTAACLSTIFIPACVCQAEKLTLSFWSFSGSVYFFVSSPLPFIPGCIVLKQAFQTLSGRWKLKAFSLIFVSEFYHFNAFLSFRRKPHLFSFRPFWPGDRQAMVRRFEIVLFHWTGSDRFFLALAKRQCIRLRWSLFFPYPGMRIDNPITCPRFKRISLKKEKYTEWKHLFKTMLCCENVYISKTFFMKFSIPYFRKIHSKL